MSETVEMIVRKSPMRPVFFHDGPTYWIRAMSFDPNAGYRSTRSNRYKAVGTASVDMRSALTCVLGSPLFYMYFKTFSNCRDFSTREIFAFPTEVFRSPTVGTLCLLADKLLERPIQTREVKQRNYPSGDVEYSEYYPVHSKAIIDEIDRVLARHYGFTDEELDFIINYDIKYRMAKVEEEEES